MRSLFVCNTPYQLFNVMNLTLNDVQGTRLASDLFIVARFRDAKKVYDRVIAEHTFESVYLIDILERQRIKNKAEFEDLVKIIASGIGAPTNPTKLENTFKSVKKVNIDSVTISRYLGYMQDAFLIEKAERYDVKGKKYIGSLAKYYFTDIGLRNAILGLRQQEETHIMENIIYNELRRRGCKVDVGMVEQRFVDNDGKWQRKQLEVDFVVNEGNQIYIKIRFISQSR